MKLHFCIVQLVITGETDKRLFLPCLTELMVGVFVIASHLSPDSQEYLVPFCVAWIDATCVLLPLVLSGCSHFSFQLQNSMP